MVKTEEVCPFVAGVLKTDRDMLRKQRHTAKRVYDLLAAEHGSTNLTGMLQAKSPDGV